MCCTPILIPADVTLSVAPCQQLLFSEPITVEGTIVVDGIIVQVR